MRQGEIVTRVGIGLTGAIAVCASAMPALAQEGRPDSAPLAVVSTVPPELAAGVVLREIDDPNSGLRWLLVEDPAHPGGPGRLIAAGSGMGSESAQKRVAQGAGPKPVIHPGEAVQVEEHSGVVDASLQAVALGTAVPGGMVRVRLRVGGRVLRARALGPGRAELLEPAGGRP